MLGNHRFFVSKATVFLCTTFHIPLKAKRRRTVNGDAGSLGTTCAHKKANLGPKAHKNSPAAKGSGRMSNTKSRNAATVVLGLGWDLGRGNTKNRENLTRVSLNPILPSAMS